MRNRKQKFLLFFFFLGLCIFATSEKTIQAKVYTNKKEVKADIKKLTPKVKKAKAACVKAKKNYQNWSKKSSNYSNGTKALFLARIVSSNPMIVSQGGSYYRITNPSGGASFLGSYTALIRLTGGYSKINGYTCANAKAVKNPYRKKCEAAQKVYRKKLKKYNKVSEKLYRLKKCLKYRVGGRTRETYVGEIIDVDSGDTYENDIYLKSSDPSVVRFERLGQLRGIKKGTAVVTATATISRKKTKFRVVVKNKGTIKLNYSSYTLGTKGTTSVELESDEEGKLKWSTSNAGVVKVNQKGKVTAVGCGTATVTVTSSKKTGTCQFTVIDPQVNFDAPEVRYTDYDIGTQKTIHFTSNIPDLTCDDRESYHYKVDAFDYHPETNPGGLVDGSITITVLRVGDKYNVSKLELFSELFGTDEDYSGAKIAEISIVIGGMTIGSNNEVNLWNTNDETIYYRPKIFVRCCEIGDIVSMTGYDTNLIDVEDGGVEDGDQYIYIKAKKPGRTSMTITTSAGYSRTCPINVYGVNFYDEEGNCLPLAEDARNAPNMYKSEIYKAYENPLFDYAEEELTGYIRIEAIMPKDCNVTISTIDEDGKVLELKDYVDEKQYYQIVDTGKTKIMVELGENATRVETYGCYIDVSEMTGVPEGADEKDVAALKKIIAAQRKRGAKVSDNLSSDEYTWDKNGKLVGIKWDGRKVDEDEGGAQYENKLVGGLDVSGCVNLKELNCSDNALTELNVSGCANLEKLSCSGNALTTLDVSGCTNLTSLECIENQLNSLDVSKSVKLTSLDCGDNGLSALNVSSCPELTNLQCYGNQLSALDVSGNRKLTSLGCSWNQLTDLDVSGCTNLTTIECDNNQLTALNLSKNTKLTGLECWMNQLDSLDVTGCVELAALRCGDNRLTALDVSKNTKLTELMCYGNQLSALDISANKELITLECSNNRLTKLDVSQNVNLVTLLCTDNGIGVLDLTNNDNLSSLDCDEGVIINGY